MSRLHHIRWRLPLSVAGLLLAVLAAFSWAAYREVHVAALSTAEARLGDVAQQLGTLLSQGVAARVAQARETAADPAVRAALTTGTDAALEQALTALDQLAAASDQTMAVTLWDATGTLVLAARGPSAVDGDRAGSVVLPTWAHADGSLVGGLVATADTVWHELVVPVPGTDDVLGYVMVRRRLTTTPEGVQLLTNLVGMQATLMVGEPGGVWTELARSIEGPPIATLGHVASLIYEPPGRAATLGSGLPIDGTPWMIWVESPLEFALERPRAFLSRAALIGTLIVLAGVAGGAALSHRITSRLSHLTAAASGIASGEYDLRAEVGGDDELDQLARAFNVMADRVADAQHHLEELVETRTAALAASEAQFRTLATTAPDGIVTADHEGRITYFNPGAEGIFGYAQDEVLDRPLTVLMPERFRDRHRQALARHVATGEGKVVGNILELEGRRRDGSTFPVELSLASDRPKGRPTFIGIIRDITRRKGDEEAIRAYAAELEAANEELEAFSYSVSHDLRAPLRAIHGFSQALVEDYSDALDEEGVDYLGRVCAATELMGRLIDDLLSLSRATRAEMRRERVDLSELAAGIAAELSATAPERTVDFRIQEGLQATGDARLLAQALRNLIGNSWKFTGKRERALIQIGVSDSQEAFFVRDDGAGFDMTYAETLFDPFRRLHSARDFKGVGIGLALVQRIVRRHGGRVWGEGAVGEGATFYFTVPAT